MDWNKALRLQSIFFICLISVSQLTYADPALTWRGYAMAEDIVNMSGGLRTGSILLTAGNLTALYDTQQAHWWRGGEFALGVLGIGQTHQTIDYTAAIQIPTGYAGVSEIRISDLAYQHTFSEKFMLRAGIMDIDDYFNYMQVAYPLINSAFTNTVTLNYNIQLPTYPYPGFGALAKLGSENNYLIVGAYQGNPQHQTTVFERGQLLIAELVNTFCAYDAKYIAKIGIWDYQQNLEYVGTSDHGVYFIAEAFYCIPTGRKLGLGLNLGLNPKKYDTVTDSIAACLTINNIFPKRSADSLNFGIGRVWLNGAPHPETFYEVGYRVQITPNLNLTPDLQYFTHPSGIYGNAWVGILHIHYKI